MPQTVFITNRSDRHEYDSALTYGALRYVTQGNYPVFKTARLQEEIINVVIHSQPADYLLFSGSALVAALCLTVWMQLHGKVRALVWDNKQYIVREITRSNIRLDIERAIEKLEADGITR